MKAASFEIPVGFCDIGQCGAAGFKVVAKPDGYKYGRAFGGDIVRTHACYRLELKVDLSHVDPLVLAVLHGSRLAYLALQFRRINPHWYLEGGQDD